MPNQFFTFESVTEGHPDKIANQISDAVVDRILGADPANRAAIDGASCDVMVAIDAQSEDIAQGLETSYESRTGTATDLDRQGAGDQGLMFGYACKDTPELETLDLQTGAHQLYVNATGRFEIGGPTGNAGLTGRKIISESYGGMARHDGGAFPGKDPSKVDRSAAYAMRWVTKDVVAADLIARSEVQVAYAIGKARPVGLYVDCFGTEQVPLAHISAAIDEVFDLRSATIVPYLDVGRPIYSQTAVYGDFGRDVADFTWERTDRANALVKVIKP